MQTLKLFSNHYFYFGDYNNLWLHILFLICREVEKKTGTLVGEDKYGNKYYENKKRYFFGESCVSNLFSPIQFTNKVRPINLYSWNQIA